MHGAAREWRLAGDLQSLGAWCRTLVFYGPLSQELAATYVAAAGGPPAEHAVVANFTVVCRWCVWAELQLLPKDYTHCR